MKQSLAKSVASLVADSGVMSSIPAPYICIDLSGNIFYSLSPSGDRLLSVSHLVLSLSLPWKKVWLGNNNRLNMTIAVDWGVKP